MPFAEKLSRLRKEKGFTQQEMARKAGVGIAQLRRYERGKSSPTLEVIKNISRTLGVTTDELIFDENEGVANNKIMDRQLLEQFEVVSAMRQHEKNAIKTILESMILKSRLEDILPAQKDESWSREMKEVVTEFRKGAEEYSDDEIEDIVDEAVNAVRAQDSRKEKAVGA
ncbi:MAG: helix-turn-helix domain-containing protein [Desulfobacteraceae bacterium]|jgi:transcriptional regulator with XRE-family HTH domain